MKVLVTGGEAIGGDATESEAKSRGFVRRPKVLFVATVSRFVSGFLKAQVDWFLVKGWEVHVASHGTEDFPVGVRHIEVPFARNPISPSNIPAFFKLRRLIRQERYSLISCHTPVGGALSRLAALGLRGADGVKVVYTPHGFHFFRGAPLKNWIIYFCGEWLLSGISDALITIVEEDFKMTRDFRFPCKLIYLTNGIGIETSRLNAVANCEKQALRKEFGYSEDALILIYAAEFIARKNHELIVKAIPRLKENFPHIRILFAGCGVLENEIKSLAENLGVEAYVDFLGFRRDLPKLIKLSDVGISSSRQEGLPMNIAEEMYLGLPIIASSVRGNRDLVINNETGLLFKSEDVFDFAEKAEQILGDSVKREAMGAAGKKRAEEFTIERVMKDITQIYEDVLCGNPLRRKGSEK